MSLILTKYMSITKVLIAAIHFPVASGRYMTAAFRRIGCDVRTCGPIQGNEIWGTKVDPKYIWEPNYTAGNVSGDYGITGTLKALDNWMPDLIVCMDSGFTIVGDKADFPCPKVLYGVDNHLTQYDRNGEWYDKLFLAHHDGPARPVNEAAGEIWLPCGYDPHWFTPSPIPIADRKIDIALVGWPTPERVEIVDAMREAKLSVVATLGEVYDSYRDIYHNAKISLCRSAMGDVAQRIFETAAMGCCLLANDVSDFERLGFKWGIHYHSFLYAPDAVSNAKWLLANNDVMEEFAKAGQRWAIPHTWDARAKTILETMELK